MKSFLTLIACLFIAAAHGQGYRIENNEVKPDGVISFVGKTATLSDESKEALTNIKKFLAEKNYISTLRVEGHADGFSDNNQSLSEARALAVCAWLVNNGIDCKRLIPVGFADTKPVSYESNVLNTRIVFANAALRGHAIGGMPPDGGGKVAGDPCK